MKKNIYLFVSFILLLAFSNPLFGQDALDDFVNAEKLRQKGSFKEALAMYDQAIQKDATNSKFYFHKGKCYIHLSQEQEAIKCFEKAVEVQESNVEVHSRLARLYIKNNKVDKAIKSFDNVFKFDKDDKSKVRSKLNIVRLLLKNKRFKEAGKHIDDGTALAPENLDLLYFNARFHNDEGSYEKAKTSMLKATSLLKTNVPKEISRYYFELSRAYYNLEDYENAQAIFSKARYGRYSKDIVRMTAQYHHSLALSYFNVYEYDKSKALVEKAKKMRPDFSRAHDLSVKIATAHTDKSAVIDHQKSSIETEKTPLKKAQKYVDLSELELEGGRYEDAINSANQALTIQPKNYVVKYIKAVAEYKLGQTQEAISTLEGLISMLGVDADTKAKFNFTLGLFQKNTNKTAEAASSFKAAYFGTYKYAAREEYENLTHHSPEDDE